MHLHTCLAVSAVGLYSPGCIMIDATTGKSRLLMPDIERKECWSIAGSTVISRLLMMRVAVISTRGEKLTQCPQLR